MGEEPRLEGLLGAGREVVFSEIHQEWLVSMQEGKLPPGKPVKSRSTSPGRRGLSK